MINQTGPVSAALEAHLRSQIRKTPIRIWLDVNNHYSNFVDGLIAARQAGQLPYNVRAFRGSHLALMLELEDLASGSEPTPLVIHLPGFNEERVNHSPLLELYKAGKRYQKALDTIITEAAAGRVHPDQIEAYTAQPDLTLSEADAWLDAYINQNDGGFDSQIQALSISAVLDDLLDAKQGFIAQRLAQPGIYPQDGATLWARLSTWLGVPKGWLAAILPETTKIERAHADDVAFAAASWALCVEYVDDLKRPPISPLLTPAQQLPQSVIDTCYTLAAHLRDQHPAYYQRTANETQGFLADEIEAVQAEDLGQIDTFRFEEDAVLDAAIAALRDAKWTPAAEWAKKRLTSSDARTGRGGGNSFWLGQDPNRQSSWQLVKGAAHLGQTIAHAGERLDVSGSPETRVDEALARYVASGAAVDQAHRHLEQRRVELLYPQLPQFEDLRTTLDRLRQHWQQWADGWAREFNQLCRAHGFLPTAANQQRTLFDDVVKPMTQEAGTTAYFVVDALRYEMGQELYSQLVDTPASTVQLKARLAELPTITAVGMNVLAPVAEKGKLTPVLSGEKSCITGFSTGEFRVTDPESRKRAMHDRIGGNTAPWLSLDEVIERNSTSLERTVRQARLMVVHSREIDKAGETDVGLSVYNNVMQKLNAAWRLLREAGVRRFVFTADHGFLLIHESTGSVQSHGRKVDPAQRHIISPVAADHTNEVRVPLADLGYTGAEGNLMFPKSTALFDTGRKKRFAHGGNSLQERVIPVLTVVHRAAVGGNMLQYGISAKRLEGVAGMHCLQIKSEVVSQMALDFGTPQTVDLALRVIQTSNLQTERIQVELNQPRGKATLVGGLIRATVGHEFELFFRLTGPHDAQVQVEIHHPSAVADVTPYTPDAHFDVTPTRLQMDEERAAPAEGEQSATDNNAKDDNAAAENAAAEKAPMQDLNTGQNLNAGWLSQLPEGGVRDFFGHLAAHGTVTESEAANLLGGPRKARRFANQLDEYAQKAPFDIRIDVVAGVKRYVRE